MLHITCLLAATAAAVYAHGHGDHLGDLGLIVRIRTGTFRGDLNDTYPDVRQFKYIRYAKPPVGKKRWTSPEKLDNDTHLYGSTVFGPACRQFVTAVPSAWALNITGNLVRNYGESLLAGQVAQHSAEDCLSLAIWTPANVTADSGLPVVVYLTGGGDVTGGVDITTQHSANWVHRSQKDIVITTNHRVNIFGFPNARGLNGSTNFALQDRRAAVEWVAENIKAFGGNPVKSTLWGQSAGAGATDMYLVAWAEDPIIRASVSSSGVAVRRTLNRDYTGSNFTFVAKSLGCDFEDAATELEYMRWVPMPRIENFVGQYQDNQTLVNASQPATTFVRQERPNRADPEDDWHNLPQASPLVPYPINNFTAGPSEARILTQTLATLCAAYNTSVYRDQTDLAIYRYERAGNFTNISPVWWLGAYHYSDLYMFFGTYYIAPGEITGLERQTSARMQDLLYDFVANPNSLPENGWPEYQATGNDGGQLARFGADEQVLQLVNGDEVDGACHIFGAPYDTSP